MTGHQAPHATGGNDLNRVAASRLLVDRVEMRCTSWIGIFVAASTVTAASAAPVGNDDDDVVEDEVEDKDDEDEDDLEDEELVDDIAPRSKPRRKPTNEFYFRAGIAHIQPNIKSGGLELEPVGIVKLAPMAPVQGGIEADPTNIFAAIIGFAPAVFHGYIAFETIVALPKSAKLKAKGDLANKSLAPTAAGLIETGIPPLGEELGEAQAVPPMLTVVFRAPALGPLRVYAGGGASVLFVRDAKVTNKVLTEVATPKLEISPAFGLVAQAGVDVQLYKRFYARFDVKQLWFQESETRISNIHVRTTIPLLETVEVGSGRSVAQATPLIVQLGIGASF